MNSIIIKTLLLFYIFSSYIGATHFHTKPIKSFNDCKVHILIKNLNTGNIPTLDNIPLVYNDSYRYIYPIDTFLVLFIQKGFNSQAPPTIS
ncbi:MAG: hypothetical protein GXO60_05665 [Epsilonproteobacteria bacterium]|nr:hypothetical protein [Campylobacterota bacterium]